MKVLAHHRSATFHYEILDRFEAGLSLLGSEVKSLRLHRASLAEAFIVQRGGQLFLHNMFITPYTPAHSFGHDPKRERPLLLHKRQIHTITGGITRKGMTAIPLKLYINARGWIKLEVALAVGKKQQDKRQTLKEKEWKRQQHRVLKTNVSSSV